MTNAGMIEDALCDFFRSDAERGFQVVEESSKLLEITRPGLTWSVSDGVFETNSSGVLMEVFSATCLAVAKNVASEKFRRAEVHELSQKIISRLSGMSLSLQGAGMTGAFKPVSWADATGEIEFEKRLVLVRIKFSVSMPAQAEQENAEDGSNSLKENIRMAVKKLLDDKFGYRTLPTLGNWKFLNNDETLAKVFWGGSSAPVGISAHSFARRQDVLNIVVAVPNTPENWQDVTSQTEENFNYGALSRDQICQHMPKHEHLLANVEIGETAVEHPALPEAYAVSKISLIVQYAIVNQRG